MIIEHYHITVSTKEDMPELTVCKEGNGWIVDDDWCYILEKGGRMGTLFSTLKEAVEYAYDRLKERYPNCEKCYGAGFPDFWNEERDR
jgi:hypothetical protein